MTDRTTPARSSQPTLHRYARPAIFTIASLGAIETAFLTWVELNDRAADFCTGGGCDTVLTSNYAAPFGIPLPALGFLAYVTMAIAARIPRDVTGDPFRASDTETVTSWILAIGGAIMATVSGYLMYVLFTELQAFCPYCIASALFSLTIFLLSIFGRTWDDFGGVSFTLAVVAAVTLTGAFGTFANAAQPLAAVVANSGGGYTGAPLTHHSDRASIALARHLTEVGAKQFGAYWCPHCHTQKELFGIEAFAQIDYVECDPKGLNARADLCRSTGIHSFPTWEIDGQLYEGIQELEALADLTGYTGDHDFSYTLASMAAERL